MTPKLFLKWGGLILLILGVLGFVVPALQQPNPTFYLDEAENWAHLILGLVALAASTWMTSSDSQKWLVALVGLIALYFGIWGFLVANNPMPNYNSVTNLETLDNIIHLVVAVWALYAAFGKRS